jgi:AcrR family transcriptional regulator
MKAQTRAEKHAATTRALLDGAAQTFAERGFESATMDEIAERVGLSKGALYYRFANKQDLFLALLDQRCQMYVEELTATVAHGPSPVTDPAEAAMRFVRMLRDDAWPRLFIEFVSYANRDPRHRRRLRRRMADLRAAITAGIERATEAAQVPLPLAPERLAMGVVALSTGWAVEHLADPRGMPDELYGELLELMVLGVGARAQRERSTGARRT